MEYRKRHQVACLGFSVVTVLFQLAFASTICAFLDHTLLWLLVLGVSVPIVWGWVRVTAIFVTVASAILILGSVFGVGGPPAALPDPTHWNALIGLAPCLIFGFLLCPYLDLTFLRARTSLDRSPSRLAFGFGFGGVFLFMMVLTYLYAGPVLQLLASGGNAETSAILLRAIGCTCCYKRVLQCRFTRVSFSYS